MKREIREKRNQLYKQSCMLKKAGAEEKDFQKSQELYKEQDKIYKQW